MLSKRKERQRKGKRKEKQKKRGKRIIREGDLKELKCIM